MVVKSVRIVVLDEVEGMGFIEYYTHRSALMGLRWLNGHAVGYQVKDSSKPKAGKEEVQDRKKRLIVEFAIENAQVVMRRKDREQKARDRSQAVGQAADAENQSLENGKGNRTSGDSASHKRKRGPENSRKSTDRKRLQKIKLPNSKHGSAEKEKASAKKPIDEKLARRNQIIGRKRAMRRVRKGTKH